MKKFILMLLTTVVFPDLFPWQKLVLDLVLIFIGKMLCKDFVLYFNEHEAKTMIMKKIRVSGLKCCGYEE